MQGNQSTGQINQTIFTKSNINSNNQSSQGQFVFSPVQLQNRLEQYHRQQHHLCSQNQQHHHQYYHWQEQIQHNKDVQQQASAADEPMFINSNSIVKRYQLLLITLLIMSSIASVRFSNQGTFNHIKTITDRFNMQFLGNTNPAIYQFGDNIDQSSTEFVIFEDMCEHFDDVVEVVENFTVYDTFMEFDYQYGDEEKIHDTSKEICQIEVYYLNGTYNKTSTTIKGLEDFLFTLNKRQFLLSIKQMEIFFAFGQNKRLQSLNLTLSYSLSSRMMLNVELFVDYKPNQQFKKNYNDFVIRIIEQLLAFLLLCSYLHNVYTIKLQNITLKKLNLFHDDVKTLQTNRAYWCYSLVLLNIITMLTETYAPLASFLQLLPIFQRHDSANVYKYNFNTNLRYAVPIVMRIFIPVVILLNGFILYSMIMYPGEYFDDYATGLFSYVYQNFQVGTYEIFIQIQSSGNFAYLLYGVLYFYMVLVGSNLLPALFCTMIYIKIYQNDLKDHINKTIKSAICPKCGNQNLDDKQEKQFQLNIQSPKISPYLKGKLSTVSNKNKQSQLQLVSKVTKMFVQTEKDSLGGDQKLKLKSSVDRIKMLSMRLETIVTKQTKNRRQLQLFDQKIEKVVDEFQETVILSPLRSPIRRGE